VIESKFNFDVSAPLMEPIIPLDRGIELVTEETINDALFSQSIKKASGIDHLNFKAIRLLWL